MDEFSEKLRAIFAGMFTLAGIVLLLLLLVAAKNFAGNGSLQQDASQQSGLANGMLGGPNAVADGMSAAAKGVGQAAHNAGTAVSNAASTAATAIGNGVSFVGSTISTGFGLMLHVPVTMLETAATTPSASALIRPADYTQVPMIDAYVSKSAPVTLPTVKTASHSAPSPIWPINGKITTLFGVPHWPYQPTHTGLDISSGNASGITKVKPFAPGRVIETIRASYGLGNHVIVDHGSGITSVYAHLSSISVSVGQKVDARTTLGYEGSTGASTGTHLHFEVRKNGAPTDPRPYLN